MERFCKKINNFLIPKDKYFKSFDIGKSKIKLDPISSPDCSGNPFLVTELAEVTKKDCNEKQD